MAKIYFALAFCFTLLLISTGGRPIRIENGNRRFRVSPTGDIGNGHFFPPVGGRTANGRPYGSAISEHRIIVGASIARPLLAGGAIRMKA